jgi:hypothetical protein
MYTSPITKLNFFKDQYNCQSNKSCQEQVHISLSIRPAGIGREGTVQPGRFQVQVALPHRLVKTNNLHLTHRKRKQTLFKTSRETAQIHFDFINHEIFHALSTTSVIACVQNLLFLAMTTLLQFSIYFSPLKKYQKPITYHSLPSSKLAFLKKDSFKSRSYREKWSLLGGRKDGIWIKEEGLKRKRRVVLVRFNQGLGGGGGGGGGDNSGTARLLGNIALAAGLTYLSMTGQLGWVFDTVGWILDTLISIWVCLSFPVFCLFFCWMIVSLNLNKFIVCFIGHL